MPAFPFPVAGATAFVTAAPIFEKWTWPIAAGNGPTIPVDAPGTLQIWGTMIAFAEPGDPTPDQIRQSFFVVNQSVKCPVAGTIVNSDDSALPNTIASVSNDGTFVPVLTLVQNGQAVSLHLSGMTANASGAVFALWYIHTPIP